MGWSNYKTFSGVRFNNYHRGDYVLIKRRGFRVDVRTRQWGAAAVNVLFAARIRGVTIEANRPENFLLNKRERINIALGQSVDLPEGGKVERIESDRWIISSTRLGYIDVRFYYYGGNLRVGKQVFQRRYMNFIIKVPKPSKYGGLCAGNEIKSGKLFLRPYHPLHKNHYVRAISPKCRRNAKLRCLNRHIARSELGDCISDVCRGLRAKLLRNFDRTVRHNRRLWKNVFRHGRKHHRKLHFQTPIGRHHHRRHHRHHHRRHHRHHHRNHHHHRHHEERRHEERHHEERHEGNRRR